MESLRGQINGRFAVRYNDSAESKWDYNISGHLDRGRLDDERLPHPWTDVQASFEANTRGFAIHKLTANSGPATLQLELERTGYHDNAPLLLVAEARQLRLDSRLAEILPAGWQDAWQKARPAGEIDLDAKLRYDGTKWTPDVAVACHNVAFTYEKFPYRLEHGAGTVVLRDNALHVDMTAYSDVEPVHLKGDVQQPGPAWSGSFTVDARRLPVDQKLSAALPPKPRKSSSR